MKVVVIKAMEEGTLWKNHTGGDENTKGGELKLRTANNNQKLNELCQITSGAEPGVEFDT